MTDKKLKELLIVIDNRYGRVRSKEDRIIDLKTCVQAFGMVPDEIVEKALYAAFAKCRFPNQIIVDWCEEIKKLQATVKPSANDLWAQAATAARQITANLYYMTHGGLVTSEGKLTGENFKTRNAEIFAALPVAVQRWAGSPAELSMTFGRDGADLLQFVKPGFVRARTKNWKNSIKKCHRAEIFWKPWQPSKDIREMITVHRIWWAGRYRRQTGCWEWMNLCNRLPVCYRMWKVCCQM